MREVYIVLTGTHVGGTQKRFIELWDRLQSLGYSNIQLALTRMLFERLQGTPYLRHFTRDNPGVHLLDAHRERDIYPQLFRLALRVPRGTVFHYPLGGLPLVHRALGQRVLISYNNNTYFQGVHRSLRLRALFWANALFADRIDVLNPIVYHRFRSGSIGRDKVCTGGGSFVDLDAFQPHADKRDWIVFLGRLTKGDDKNVLRFLSCLPAMHQRLVRDGRDVRYFILGHGPLEERVHSTLVEPAYRALPIEFRFHPNPLEVLRHAKVFLSLQRASNYPSKSLLEAVASGVLPVVTDVGESRLIATSDFAQFVPGDFDADDLSRAVLNILNQPVAEYEERSRIGREFVRNKFSFETQACYYLRLYGLPLPEDSGVPRPRRRP